MEQSLDFNILRALSTRDRFIALRDSVPSEMVDSNTATILTWFGMYFQAHEDHLLIDPAALLTYIKLRGGYQQDQMGIYENIIQRLGEPLDDTTLRTTVQTLEELRLSGESAALIARFQNGEEVDLAYELQLLAQRTKQRMERTSAAKWASDDPLVYIEAAADDSGLQWDVFPHLRQTLKGLREGHNIAVAAPTDAGKTSLLCELAVCFAKQAQHVFPDQPLLYLLNEGTAEGVTPRMLQTALHVNNNELLRLARAGNLRQKFADIVGRWDAIRLVNIHGMKLSQVSRIIEAHKPYMVISDMTGRITANSNHSGGSNDIGQLEEVWNSMRELAAIQHFIHMGTVQVSAEGFDMLYPPLSAMQNSKTGIQTTLDMCLMMGRMDVQGAANMETVRGISTPKNKLARSGCKSLNQFPTTFDASTNTWDVVPEVPRVK